MNEGYLNMKDLGLMNNFESSANDVSARQDQLDEQGAELAGLFIKILKSIADIGVVEYTLVQVDQLFSAEKTPEQVKVATEYFLEYARANPKVDIAAPFLQIISTESKLHNSFTFLRVQHILATLLSASYGRTSASAAAAAALSPEDEAAQRGTVVHFLRFLISKISNLTNSSPVPGSSSSSFPSSPTSSAAANNRELMACLGALKNLLRSSPRIQDLFVEADGVRAIAALLNKETQNAQLLYLVGFNIWLLSYHQPSALKLKEFGVIKKLVSVVKVNAMEKVIRIGFAILRNFLDFKNDSFNEEMIGHGLVSVVDTLSKRKFKDPDVLNDMRHIQEVLAETIRNMSTFEKYSVEIMSGELTFNNPAHKNEIFWRENIAQFEGKGFILVRELIKWAAGEMASGGVNADKDELVREVACFDLGEFARFHPDGKKVLHRMRAKEVLMKNLQDKSPKVSKAALLATQKLMVANWEFLNKSSSGGVASLVSQSKK